jgi:hypothetical protein
MESLSGMANYQITWRTISTINFAPSIASPFPGVFGMGFFRGNEINVALKRSIAFRSWLGARVTLPISQKSFPPDIRF